jgi:hypothetical protein
VDPVARRFMWKVISEVATQDRSTSVILTTHSMEECEALCTRVGIMVGGRMRCLGTPQHLRSKYGSGFQVEVKLAEPSEAAVATLCGAIRRVLAPAGAAVATAASIAPASSTAVVLSSPGGGLISRADLQMVCGRLGQPARFPQISETGTGWALHSALERSLLPRADLPPLSGERAIPIADFAAWWALESDVDAVTAYFTAEAFPGTTTLERQGQTVRYKVPAQADPLGAVFAKVEVARTRAAVAGLSVNQTTLEQIFIQFSRQQTEERGVARGFAAEPPRSGPGVGGSAALTGGGTDALGTAAGSALSLVPVSPTAAALAVSPSPAPTRTSAEAADIIVVAPSPSSLAPPSTPPAYTIV